MAKLARQALFLAIALFCFPAPAWSQTLRFAVPSVSDPATRVFVEQFEKSPLLAAAELQIQTLRMEEFVLPAQAVAALENKTFDLALLPYISVVPNASEGLAYVSLLASPTIAANPREQFAIQDSVYGDKIAVDLGSRKLVFLAFWNRSPSFILAKKPVKTLDDLKGQKIASIDVGSRKMILALGALPTQPAGGEIFAALERGLVDGAELAPLNPAIDKAFLNAGRGGTLVSNFRQPLGFLVTNQSTWLGVTQQQRDAIARSAKAAQQAARSVVLADEERLPAAARENQLQLLDFKQLGQPSSERSASALWLQEKGEAGRPAFELLRKVKLDLARPPQPQRGGGLQPPKPATVMFATIRNDENNADLAKRFGIRRIDNPVLSCGPVSFALPASRQPGEEFDGAISVQPGSSVATGNTCNSMIGDVVDKTGGRLAIYVHGFWNSMAFAVRRTIGFATDLQIASPVVVWSWPSADNPSLYEYDEDSVAWSRIHFQDWVRALLSDNRIKRITLISHSMGGRLAQMGLEAAHGHPRKSVIGDAIFAAPDVIVPDFRQYTSRFGAAAERITLYATTNDRALLISTGKHKEDLAGLGGAKIVVMNGLESVDATDVESFVSPNHSYAFEVVEVIKDLGTLLAKDMAADKRGLKKIPKDNLYYWVIQANP